MNYHIYQAHCDWLSPLHLFSSVVADTLHQSPFAGSKHGVLRRFAATCALIDLARLTHKRPAFGIERVATGKSEWQVREEVVQRTAFGTLLRFRKLGAPAGQPRVLIVAPLSGHFATLLRDTVRVMLPEHDVLVTDWHNARDVPLSAGRFGLDEFVEHVMTFLRRIGPPVHLMAICQPCVAALAAVALMAEQRDPATPSSLTLMAGPVDCRINPTKVNQLAAGRPIEWFEANLIGTVPFRFAGAHRRVYPGFLQLAAFMNMNLERHVQALRAYFNHVVDGERDKMQVTRNFYREYFAVADLPAEFYLETVQRVFQEYELARGKLKWRGRAVEPRFIRRTALLTVEGEKDDICSLGQTLAAQDLCARLPAYLRTHFVQAGTGHYGVFSGRRWESSIFPVVRSVIHSAQ